MRIIFVTNAWPINSYPAFGIHVKRQYESLSAVKKNLFFINARDNGLLAYVLASYHLHLTVKEIGEESIVIHVHNHLTFLSVMPYLVWRGWCDRTVVSIMGDANSRGLFYYILVRFVQKYAGKVIDKTGKLKGAEYLPNGVDINFWSRENCLHRPPEFSKTCKNIIMVTASKHSRNKRLDLFYGIAKTLENEAYNFVLVSGKSPLELRNYYAFADLLLLLSDSEGSPNCIKEMLSMNGLVLSRDVGDLQKYNGFSGVTIADYNSSIEDYCKLIHSLDYGSPVKSRLELIRKGYSNEYTAKALMDVYSSCQ
jgi:glycosyltransferase involved in cell wall biosynthesis